MSLKFILLSLVLPHVFALCDGSLASPLPQTNPEFCSFTYPTPITRQSAWIGCGDQFDGQPLAVIADQADQNLVNTVSTTTAVWIDLKFDSSSNTWKWTNGFTSTYTNWAVGEPSTNTDGTFTNRCVISLAGSWQARPCTDTNQFVCSLNAPESTPPVPTASPTTKECNNWKYAIATGVYGNYDIGAAAFNKLFQNSPYYIIRRECLGCYSTHQTIYYRRKSNSNPLPNAFEPYAYMISGWYDVDNIHGSDFDLYSDLDDAINDNTANRWLYCNFNDRGIGFPRDCNTVDVSRGGQWTSLYTTGSNVANFVTKDIRYSIYYPNNGNKCQVPNTCYQNMQDNCLLS